MILVFQGEPLSTNHVWKHSCRNGYLHSYLTPAGASMKEQYMWEATVQWKQPILLGDVQLDVTLFFGTRRKRDADNFNKLVLDALQGIVYANDNQVVRLTISKSYDKERPRVEVCVA